MSFRRNFYRVLVSIVFGLDICPWFTALLYASPCQPPGSHFFGGESWLICWCQTSGYFSNFGCRCACKSAVLSIRLVRFHRFLARCWSCHIRQQIYSYNCSPWPPPRALGSSVVPFRLYFLIFFYLTLPLLLRGVCEYFDQLLHPSSEGALRSSRPGADLDASLSTLFIAAVLTRDVSYVLT